MREGGCAVSLLFSFFLFHKEWNRERESVTVRGAVRMQNLREGERKRVIQTPLYFAALIWSISLSLSLSHSHTHTHFSNSKPPVSLSLSFSLSLGFISVFLFIAPFTNELFVRQPSVPSTVVVLAMLSLSLWLTHSLTHSLHDGEMSRLRNEKERQDFWN